MCLSIQKPDEAGLSSVVAPVGAAMQAANTLAENRRSQYFNHNKAVAESLQSLSWVIYSGPSSGEDKRSMLGNILNASCGV